MLEGAEEEEIGHRDRERGRETQRETLGGKHRGDRQEGGALDKLSKSGGPRSPDYSLLGNM